MLVSVALAFLASAAEPAATAAPPEAPAPAAKPKRVCHVEEAVTGSLTPKRVCVTVPDPNASTPKPSQESDANKAPATPSSGAGN